MEWVWFIAALHLCYLIGGVPVIQSAASLYNRSCSYQVTRNVGPPLKDEACLIYNLSGCPSNVWKNDGFSVGSFPVQVNVSSYVYARSGLSRAAVNFTFAVTDERVSGFAFRLLDGCENQRPICRYYDFNSLNKRLLSKTVFFNDDIYFLVSYTQSDCNVEIVALSTTGEALGFKQLVFKIPDRDTIDNLAKWKSLVIVDVTSYVDETVDISFTSAPKLLNVSSYVLQLYDKTSDSTVSCDLINGTEKVNHIRFGNIVAGLEYIFRVAPADQLCGCKSKACNFAESPAFFPKEYLSEIQPMLYIVIAFVVVLLIAIILIVIQRQRERPAYLKEKEITTVYLVYSHDVSVHITVVEALAAYLKNHCFCKVLLDKWDVKNKDPHVWVDDCISSADYVLIIWSQGAFMKMSKKNSKIISYEPGYLGEDLFSLTMFNIKAAIGCELRKPSKQRNLHKFCHISFPYVPRDMVARDLPSLPVFSLPRDFNTMLCHFHRIQPAAIWPFNKYPTFEASNLSRSSDGALLLNTIDSVTREEYGDLFKARLEDVADQTLCPSVITFSSRAFRNEVNSDAESIASEADVDGGHYGIVDNDFPLNEMPLYGSDIHESSYWLPSDAMPDDQEVSSSFVPLVDIIDCNNQLT